MQKTMKFVLSAAAVLLLAAGLQIFFPHLQAQVFSSPMRDVDNPARQPVFLSGFVFIQANGIPLFTPLNYQVPAGKRLIVTYVSFSGAAYEVSLHSFSPNSHLTTSEVVIPNHSLLAAGQELFLFANPGDDLQVTGLGSVDQSFEVFVNGYLVNLP